MGDSPNIVEINESATLWKKMQLRGELFDWSDSLSLRKLLKNASKSKPGSQIQHFHCVCELKSCLILKATKGGVYHFSLGGRSSILRPHWVAYTSFTEIISLFKEHNLRCHCDVWIRTAAETWNHQSRTEASESLWTEKSNAAAAQRVSLSPVSRRCKDTFYSCLFHGTGTLHD